MTKPADEAAVRDSKKRHERELEGSAGGAVVGAAIGAVAGPPGAIAGAVVGAIAGAVTGLAVQDGDEARDAETQKLDGEIGVSGGDLGAPNLKHPPAKIGAYSGTSVGLGPPEDDEEPAEGPIEPPND